MRPDVRHNLSASYLDGFTYSLMVGFAESYFAAFILLSGHSAVASGLVVSLPLIGGSILQLFSPYFVMRLKSYKKWILISASLQSLTLFALGLMAKEQNQPIVLLFGLISIYWGASMAAGPSWNAWMSHLVPVRLRTPFFARRSAYCQLAVLIGLLSAGLLMDRFSGSLEHGNGFIFIFFLASLLRILSGIFISAQAEPPLIRIF